MKSTMYLGHNHVYLTARDGIGIIAQNLWFCCPNFWEGFLQAKWAKEILTKEFGQQNRRVRATIPKESLTRPHLRFPNFPPKDNGQRYHVLKLDVRDCALGLGLVHTSKYFQHT